MSDKKTITIAIDGPSGVGKSTISRKVAARFGFTYLDTGAMYRAVAWYIKKQRIDLDDSSAIETALEHIDIDLLPAKHEPEDVGVLLNNEDVSELIRSPEMSMLASSVSAIPAVRNKLTRLQQELGRRGNIVAEGRDTGTIVFPGAEYKFYLDARPQERSGRRARQLRAKGETVDEEKLLEMTIARDKQDSERDIAPLRKADDAVVIDTTELDIAQVLNVITDKIRL